MPAECTYLSECGLHLELAGPRLSKSLLDVLAVQQSQQQQVHTQRCISFILLELGSSVKIFLKVWRGCYLVGLWRNAWQPNQTLGDDSLRGLPSLFGPNLRQDLPRCPVFVEQSCHEMYRGRQLMRVLRSKVLRRDERRVTF